MASVAARLRPPLVSALVLAGLAAVPWSERHPDGTAAAIARGMRASMQHARSRDLAQLLPLAPPSGISLSLPELLPQHFELLPVPPGFRDARPWPEGMVMGVPAVDPNILVWDGSPLANMLSAFLVPLRALTT